MKVLSEEEQKAHYNQVLKGGAIGGGLFLGLGLGGVFAASRRYPSFRGLTVPFRAFLVTSTATFGAIINADRYSNQFHKEQNPMNFYKDESTRAMEQARDSESSLQRIQGWAKENRYSIIFASWAAAVGISLSLLGRNKYLTSSQKIVQARVYAQGLTVALLIGAAALETKDARNGEGRWETVMVLDPEDPEHKHMIEKRIHKEEYQGQDLWKDMVAAEEKRMEARKNGKATAPKA